MSDKILNSITNNKLFKDIKEEELNLQLHSENLLYKQAGDIIYKEGDAAEEIFLVVSGEIRIIKERLLGIAKRIFVKADDFFGEEDFLENMPHTSIAFANKDCCLFIMTRSQMEFLRNKDEKIFTNLKRESVENEKEENISIESEYNEKDKNNTGSENELNLIEPNKENLNLIEEIVPPSETRINKESEAEWYKLILKEIKSIIGNVKIEDVLIAVKDSVKRLTHSEDAIIYLMNKDKDEISAKVFNGNIISEIRLKKGIGIAGIVADKGEVINIADVQNDKRFTIYYDGIGNLEIRNMLCSPIRNKSDEIIGVFYLVNCKYGEFSKIDEKLLGEFSSFVIQSLENTDTFENILQEEKSILLNRMNNFLNQEIKKPILVSKRFAEHLKLKDPSADYSQILDMQLEQLSFISDLIQSTSNFTEIKPALQLAQCKLNEALNEILGKLDSSVIIRKCQIEKKFDRDTLVNLDKREFYFVCYHILKNACDAMPNGGKILVSTNLNISDVIISFKDSGSGVPLEIIDKIFNPFVSYGKKDSAGLGLSVVRNIIESFGGKIIVESNPGDGAAFIITLPIK